VFTTSIGTPIHPRNLRRDFKAVLVKAELPEIRFHDLRHTAGTLLALQAVHQRTIMGLLGHSQLSTAEAYVHVADEMKADAAKRMQALLGRSA
jgi:integrase